MVRPVLGAQRLIVTHLTTGETGSPVRRINNQFGQIA